MAKLKVRSKRLPVHQETGAVEIKPTRKLVRITNKAGADLQFTLAQGGRFAVINRQPLPKRVTLHYTLHNDLLSAPLGTGWAL